MARRKRVKTDDEVFWGEEPTWENHSIGDYYMSEISKALTWYRNVAGPADKRRWLTEWCKANHPTIDYKLIKKIPEDYILSIGSFARMMLAGFQAKEKDIINLKDKVSTLVNRFALTEDKEEAPKKTAPSKAREEKLGEFYTMYDTYIDGSVKELGSLTLKLNKGEAQELREYYTKELSDIENNKSEYIDSKGLSKRHKDVLQDINKYEMVTKITRTRKKKLVTKDKQVAKLNFQNDFAEYGLISINPEKIIGAKTLLLFNTKTRALQYYVSDNPNGLTVKGSTLKDFDPDKSYSKTVRKPEEVLSKLTTQKRSEKIVSEIKAVEKKLTGRVNKDTIILKAW